MGVTIQKKKTATKPKAAAKSKAKEVEQEQEQSQEDVIVTRLNELGDAYEKIVPLKKKLKPLEKAYKGAFETVQDFVDEDAEPDEEVTLKTDKYAVTFSEHGNSTTVTQPGKCFKILESIEKGLGQKLMTFPIGELRKYLTEEQIEQVTKTERTTARKVTVAKIGESEGEGDE